MVIGQLFAAASLLRLPKRYGNELAATLPAGQSTCHRPISSTRTATSISAGRKARGPERERAILLQMVTIALGRPRARSLIARRRSPDELISQLYPQSTPFDLSVGVLAS